MTTIYRQTFVACSVMFMLASLEASAAAQTDSWYVGAKIDWVAETTAACEDNAVSCDDNPIGGGLFVGYVLNDWLALEASYDHFSEFSATYPAKGAPGRTADYESDVNGLSFAAKPYWQMNDNWSLFGKAGLSLWERKLTGHEVDYTQTATDLGWSPLLGAGVEYAFTRNWRTTLEYQWLGQVGGSDTGEMDINTVNLGIIYQFAPEPAPVAVVSPVAPQSPAVERLALWASDGEIFASNSNDLSPELTSALQRQPVN